MYVPLNTSSYMRLTKWLLLCNHDVQFSVADTGSGIPADKRISVFERLQQLGKENRQGLGLGLYIAKKIVEAHMGRIWVENGPIEGSAFCFTLPISSKKN